jgi:hypothetical protein
MMQRAEQTIRQARSNKNRWKDLPQASPHTTPGCGKNKRRWSSGRNLSLSIVKMTALMQSFRASSLPTHRIEKPEGRFVRE